jgi:pimeloyl-ACP methyl ester carboxylesterase
MGAGVAWGMNRFHPDRLRSLISGGGGVSDDPTGPLAIKSRLLGPTRKSLEIWQIEGADAYLEHRKALAGPSWSPELREKMLSLDLEAIVAWLALRQQVGLEVAARSTAVSSLIYCGEDDELYPPARATADMVPGAILVSLPGLDHGSAFARSDLVLPHVLEFLAEVEKGLNK